MTKEKPLILTPVSGRSYCQYFVGTLQEAFKCHDMFLAQVSFDPYTTLRPNSDKQCLM